MLFLHTYDCFWIHSSIFSKPKVCKDPMEKFLTFYQYLHLPKELPALLITSASFQLSFSLMQYSIKGLIFANMTSFMSEELFLWDKTASFIWPFTFYVLLIIDSQFSLYGYHFLKILFGIFIFFIIIIFMVALILVKSINI